jgi:hypothetical protein
MPVDDQRVIVGLPYAVPGGRPRRCRAVRLRLYKPSASINHDAARERTRQDDWDLAQWVTRSHRSGSAASTLDHDHTDAHRLVCLFDNRA